jgi:mRNA interferase RelE/StbE
MTWAVFLSNESIKNLKKLPPHITKRAKEAVCSIAHNPTLGKPLKESLKGQFSLRIGDYRIVYLLKHSTQRIFIIYIRHRKDAYK